MPPAEGSTEAQGGGDDSPVIHSQLGKSCCSDCTVISPPATPGPNHYTQRMLRRTPQFSSGNWVSSQWYPDEMNANWQGGNSMVSGVSGPRG